MNQKAERPTLALLDDQCRQVVEALVLNVLRTAGAAMPAAEMSDSERADALRPHERYVRHSSMLLREVLRRAAALGEQAVLEEMNRLGVERPLVETAIGATEKARER